MNSLAARRQAGPAMGPALFLLALLVPASLMSGCRQQSVWQDLEGVVLETGYHITLNGDLQDEGHYLLLVAAIQGELASLESEFAALHGLLLSSLPLRDTRAAEFPAPLIEALREVQQARAVDRLDSVLAEFGFEHAMIELGGVVRTRGSGGRQPWRLALGSGGLSEALEPSLMLSDAALVTRLALGQAGRHATGEGRLMAVSVVAPSAELADRQARKLLGAGMTEDAMEQAARLVVLTPQGIEIHYGAALEPLLDR